MHTTCRPLLCSAAATVVAVCGCQGPSEPPEPEIPEPAYRSEIQARFDSLLDLHPPSLATSLASEDDVRSTPSPVQWSMENPFDPEVTIGWWPPRDPGRGPVRIALIDESFDVAAAGLEHAFDAAAGVNLLEPDAPLWSAHRDGFHHGNLVASIIANRPRDEVGPLGILADCDVELIPIVAAGGHGPAWRSPRADPDLVLAGLRHALRQRATIINISAGTPVSPAELDRLASDPVWDRLEAAGIPVVCAAGNEGLNLDEHAYFPAGIDRPNVYTVMGIGPAGHPAIRSGHAPATNWGARTVDLAAPGERIEVQARSLRPQLVDGTSAAAAHVTAALAVDPTLPVRTSDQLRDRCRLGGFLHRTASSPTP